MLLSINHNFQAVHCWNASLRFPDKMQAVKVLHDAEFNQSKARFMSSTWAPKTHHSGTWLVTCRLHSRSPGPWDERGEFKTHQLTLTHKTSLSFSQLSFRELCKVVLGSSHSTTINNHQHCQLHFRPCKVYIQLTTRGFYTSSAPASWLAS